jgi:hypothetical protein
MNRDVEQLIENVQRMQHHLAVVEPHLLTLEAMAYERSTAGEKIKVSSTKLAYYLDDEGDLRARRYLFTMRQRAFKDEAWWHGQANQLHRLFGVDPDEQLVLPMVLDGTVGISRAELAQAREARDRREERGEAEARLVADPKHPVERVSAE